METPVSEERGIALIEFMLVMPLLFFFSIAVVDMTRWVVAYTETSRVAYEGARYAASIKDLSDAPAIVDPYAEDVIPSELHGKVITRMQRIMTEQGMEINTTYIRLQRTDSGTTNSIEIELRVAFEPYAARFTPGGLFGALQQFTSCHTIVRAPYLFSASS